MDGWTQASQARQGNSPPAAWEVENNRPRALLVSIACTAFTSSIGWHPMGWHPWDGWHAGIQHSRSYLRLRPMSLHSWYSSFCPVVVGCRQQQFMQSWFLPNFPSLLQRSPVKIVRT